MQMLFPRFYTEPKALKRIRRRSFSSLKFKDDSDPKNTHSQNERLMVKINTLSRRKLTKLFFLTMRKKGFKSIRIGHFVHEGGKEKTGKHNLVRITSFEDLNKIPLALLKEIVRMEGARTIIDLELFPSGKMSFGQDIDSLEFPDGTSAFEP